MPGLNKGKLLCISHHNNSHLPLWSLPPFLVDLKHFQNSKAWIFRYSQILSLSLSYQKSKLLIFYKISKLLKWYRSFKAIHMFESKLNIFNLLTITGIDDFDPSLKLRAGTTSLKILYDLCNWNKTKWIWIYDREKRRHSAIKDHKKAVIDPTRSHKAMQSRIRPHMAYGNIFCSLAQFLFDLEHFLNLIPRQQEQQQQQSFF